MLRTVSLISILVVSSACVGSDRGSANNTNQVIFEVAEVPSGGPIILSDRYEYLDRSVERDLVLLAKDLGLPELPKNPDPERFEFRLWTNLGGLGDGRVLAVRADGTEFRADFCAFRFQVGGAKIDKTKIDKKKLGEPRSGWHRIAYPFTSRLTTPQGLRRDPNFELQRDEPIILLEVVHRGEYGRVFYGQDTKFADGVKLKEACEFLAGEFSVDLDCHWKEPQYFN